MQRHLCRLTHGTNEEADTNRRDQRPTSDGFRQCGQLMALFKHFKVIERTRIGCHKTDTQQETEVAHAINQECLQVCINSGWLGVPETNQ